jgi:hypothetical protein
MEGVPFHRKKLSSDFKLPGSKFQKCTVFGKYNHPAVPKVALKCTVCFSGCYIFYSLQLCIDLYIAIKVCKQFVCLSSNTVYL